MLKLIFERQAEVLNKNHQVEKENGSFIDHRHEPLFVREKQMLIREYSQRIIEEIHEANRDFQDKDKFKEELIDVLNFSTNLLLICEIEYGDIVNDLSKNIYNPSKGPNHIAVQLFQLEGFLMDAVGNLKSKPWRSNAPLPNNRLFTEQLKLFYNYLWVLLRNEMVMQEIAFKHQDKFLKVLERINGDY